MLKKVQDIIEMLKQLTADMEQIKKALGLLPEANAAFDHPLTSFEQRKRETFARKAHYDELRRKREEKIKDN